MCHLKKGPIPFDDLNHNDPVTIHYQLGDVADDFAVGLFMAFVVIDGEWFLFLKAKAPIEISTRAILGVYRARPGRVKT